MTSPGCHRVGVGYDAHRLVEGRRLILGGAVIPHPAGLSGHSDADVLTHAVMDATLGAAGLGDIGRHFPPGDPRYKDISSMILLRNVVVLVGSHGYTIGNIDATILADEPALAPHIELMRNNLAQVLGVAVEQVGVKATTSEGMGFIGRREGIAAIAVAALIRSAGRDSP
ncbi:MAG TPA: 2-C-methyl-D-erythritol 2,4-cyclodiphosphate synthase [Bacillota bacterium]|nr:2-C-methyl-D-erythritol 2,4-cyclodiphosphate synthase [Bacillota bacterium]